MHVEAECAPVDLRHTIVDEGEKLGWEAGLLDGRVQRYHALKNVWGGFLVGGSLLHIESSIQIGDRLFDFYRMI
jgi:hypothetical protein